ncbi:hypothetical protein E4U17_000871 [Claviceps sp. LM77 group G4]|nr:hypothetical protein E4U17_000871 [Claviceps sp. LM77 group G4]
MFSPSSARVAASTARDWSHIDSWLLKLFPNDELPNYERNAATLEALLMLASMNEATTNDRAILSTATKLALTVAGAELVRTSKIEMSGREIGLAPRNFSICKSYLTKEGKTALHALAQTSVQHRLHIPSPEDLGRTLVHLQTSLCGTDQMIKQTNALNEHILLELHSFKEQMATFEGISCIFPAWSSKENLELQRETRLKAKQMSNPRERERTQLQISRSSSTMDVVLREEKHLLCSLTRQRTLASQVDNFRGLPNDLTRAKDQVRGLQELVRELTVHRDDVFEGLVEQASPLKDR